MSKQSEYMKMWTARWRDAAHAALGGVCVHCGFSDKRALQIDHVRGGGTAATWTGSRHNRKRVFGSLGSYYKKVAQKADSGDYQLLCANCNWIKRHENDEL